MRDEWGQRHARSANPGSGRSAVQTSVSCASIEMQIPLFQLIMEAVRSVCGCVCVCEGEGGRVCERVRMCMWERFSHIC